MVTPKIEREAEARNYGKFIISPLERGFGITLGNALRRVLLSSLEGAAVTSIRFAEVQHEFSDIPGVREDVIHVMLQVRQLRLRLYGDVDNARLHLEVRGAGTVTASDIIAPPEVEIINPELYLFTVDDNQAKLEIEMTVERGRGYSSADNRSKLPIGELPVDAIFGPVRRVNWEVGNARVGQSTNYDRLTLEIWTDGTLRPEDALSRGARVMVEHLRQLAGISEETLSAIAVEEVESSRLTSEMIETPIENLDLSVRVFNSLKRTGITTVGEVIELLEKGDEAVMSIRNFGEKSLEELRTKMREKGYLRDEQETEAE
jgi:DNA-directed RNA polymerase subunit alpha